VDWIGLGLDEGKWRALANPAMNMWVPLNSGKLLGNYTIGGLLSSAQVH
jgi:hypothetical protein